MNRVYGRYKILRCIGQGKTSFVYEAETIDNPKMKVAIKEYKPIKKDQLHKNNPLYQIISNEINFLEFIERIIQEGKGSRDFQHINRFKDVMKLEDQNSVSFLLVLEFAKNGCNLTDFLCDNPQIHEQIAQEHILQITKALKILHDLNVAHMDIKPENMLLDENFILKLSDFGLIEVNSESNEYQGTKGYMAPEVQKGEKYSTKKADIFSLGCTFIAIRSGVYPFGDGQLDMNNPIYVSLLQDPKQFWIHFVKLVEEENKFTINFEEEFKDLIERMLNNVPDKRPVIDQVLNHPYFKLYQQPINQQAFIQYMTQQFIAKDVYQIELTQIRVSQTSILKKAVIQFQMEQIGLNQFRFYNSEKDKNFSIMLKKFFLNIIQKLENVMFETEIPEKYQLINLSYLISEMNDKYKIGVLEIHEEETITYHLIELEGSKRDQNKLKKQIRDKLKELIQQNNKIINQNQQKI